MFSPLPHWSVRNQYKPGTVRKRDTECAPFHNIIYLLASVHGSVWLGSGVAYSYCPHSCCTGAMLISYRPVIVRYYNISSIFFSGTGSFWNRSEYSDASQPSLSSSLCLPHSLRPHKIHTKPFIGYSIVTLAPDSSKQL